MIITQSNQHLITATSLFFVTVLTYWFSSHGEGAVYDYHVRLTQAMLEGRLDYGENISWFELAEWQGKYYTVNPPLPAILLVPFVYLKGGGGLYQPLLSIIMGAGSVAISYFVFLKLFEKPQIALWTSLLFGFGTVHWYHAEVGSGWYVAQIVGLFFVWCGIYAGVCRRSYILAGFAFGLAYLSRIPSIACLAIVPFLNHKDFITYGAGKKAFNFLNMFKLGLGLLPGLVGNMLYNYVRFGVINNEAYNILFEKVKHEPWFAHGHLSYHYIPTHLSEMLTSLPYITDTPPYLIPRLFAMAIWITTPAFVYILFARYQTKMGILTLIALFLAAIPSLMHGGNGFTQFGYRHTLDYMPLLLILTASGFRGKINWHVKSLILLSIVMNIWGVVMISWLGTWKM